MMLTLQGIRGVEAARGRLQSGLRRHADLVAQRWHTHVTLTYAAVSAGGRARRKRRAACLAALALKVFWEGVGPAYLNAVME